MADKYSSYEEYTKHQASKLDKMRSRIEQHDKQLEVFVFKTHKAKGRVLCLAARLGGEVRAFKRHGCDAIGIDLNPGEDNPDVVKGDFHDIPFECEFDYLYTNSIDHVLKLDTFFSECRRVLKPGGTFILDLVHGKPGAYEVLDATDDKAILDVARGYFSVKKGNSGRVRFGLLNNRYTTYYLT